MTRGTKATSIDGDVSLEEWELREPNVEGALVNDVFARITRNALRDAFRGAVASVACQYGEASEAFDIAVKSYAEGAIRIALEKATAYFDVNGADIMFHLGDLEIIWSTDLLAMVRAEIDGGAGREGLEATRTLLASGIALIDEALKRPT